MEPPSPFLLHDCIVLRGRPFSLSLYLSLSFSPPPSLTQTFPDEQQNHADPLSRSEGHLRLQPALSGEDAEDLLVDKAVFSSDSVTKTCSKNDLLDA